MAQPNHTPRLAETEEAVIVLFCLVDEAYRILNPRGDRYEALKRLSDSEVVTLALVQQLRGTESQRSFLRDAERFFSHLFPGVVGLAPSSLHRRVRKLRRFLEPLRREVAAGLWSANPRHCSSTRRYFRCCTLGRSTRARALRGRRGRGGAPFRSTG
jgi:hypothetical protein